MKHELKTDSDVFQAVASGLKTYEIRINDRNFQVNDELFLRETKHTGLKMMSGAPLEYTGEEKTVQVTHILTGPYYGLLNGWVIMSIRD